MRQVILNLHGLGVPSCPLEPGEERYWTEPDLLCAALDTAFRHSSTVEALFTFDDGNRSDLETGAPLLAERGYSATFFVLAARIDQPNYLSGADIRALLSMGHRIGSHGADHVDWTGLDDTGVTREMYWAREQIEEVAGVPISEAALPFGRYDAKTLKRLRQAGYTKIYCSDGGDVCSADWPIPRTSLTVDFRAADIHRILSGKEKLRYRLRRRITRAIKRRL
jgi:peptidoglycan/xylan/chitin deacetylase (PgdA/CDA1 family)